MEWRPKTDPARRMTYGAQFGCVTLRVPVRLTYVKATSDQLNGHAEARRRWLAGATEILARDPRIEAAVLYGSFGRGDTDVWSDVDLLVFVTDVAINDVVADRMVFPERFGTVVYRLDSTWNAPVDGAQVNALYVLDSGLPLYVDWNFWPWFRAGLPADTRSLLSRPARRLQPTPATFAEWSQAVPKQPRPPVDEVDSEVLRHARFGMVPIAAKYAARGNRAKLVALLTGIGAEAVPDGAVGELSAVRGRLTALSPGEPPEAVLAVQTLCDAVQTYLGIAGGSQ